MKRQGYAGVCVVAGLTALALVAGCGVSPKRLERAQARIDALKEKGVPDSSLARPTVFLYQATEEMKRGSRGPAREAADSMEILIAEAESFYNDHVAQLGTAVEQMKADARSQTSELTGLQKMKFDSVTALVDSFVSIGWLLQAEARAKDLVALVPRLKFDNERAEELRPRVPGTWVCTEKKNSKEIKEINATKEQIFRFNTNGTVKFTQKEWGQQSQTMKVSYEFINYGTWDLAGDTIRLMIDRFRRKREQAETMFYDPKTHKKRWEKEVKAPFDSTISDGSQDLFVTFSDLKEDFSKK